MSFFDGIAFDETPKQNSGGGKFTLKPGIYQADLLNIKRFEKDSKPRLQVTYLVKQDGKTAFHTETIWNNALKGEERSVLDKSLASAGTKCTIERNGEKFGMWGKNELSFNKILSNYVIQNLNKKFTRSFSVLYPTSLEAMLNNINAKGIVLNTEVEMAEALLKECGFEWTAAEDGAYHTHIMEIKKACFVKLTSNYRGDKLGLNFGQNTTSALSKEHLSIIENGNFSDNMDFVSPDAEEELTEETTSTDPFAETENTSSAQDSDEDLPW